MFGFIYLFLRHHHEKFVTTSKETFLIFLDPSKLRCLIGFKALMLNMSEILVLIFFAAGVFKDQYSRSVE